MTTPVPMTSTGPCLVQGRSGLGTRSEANTRTTESSGVAPRQGAANANATASETIVRMARLLELGRLAIDHGQGRASLARHGVFTRHSPPRSISSGRHL